MQAGAGPGRGLNGRGDPRAPTAKPARGVKSGSIPQEQARAGALDARGGVDTE